VAEVRYNYGPAANPAGYNTSQLDTEIRAALTLGATILNVYGSGFPFPGATICPNVVIGFDPDITAQQLVTLNGVIAAHVPAGPRKPRLLLDVYNDLVALSAAQKTNINADLFVGSPPKFTGDTGSSQADLLVLWTLQQVGGLSVGDKTLVKLAAAAIYCLDNPKYLVHPSFDATILVPGDQPA
jgi:hypothetical protein